MVLNIRSKVLQYLLDVQHAVEQYWVKKKIWKDMEQSSAGWGQLLCVIVRYIATFFSFWSFDALHDGFRSIFLAVSKDNTVLCNFAREVFENSVGSFLNSSQTDYFANVCSFLLAKMLSHFPCDQWTRPSTKNEIYICTMILFYFERVAKI